MILKDTIILSRKKLLIQKLLHNIKKQPDIDIIAYVGHNFLYVGHNLFYVGHRKSYVRHLLFRSHRHDFGLSQHLQLDGRMSIHVEVDVV